VQEPQSRLRLICDLGRVFAARLELDELIPLVVTRCREVFAAEGVAVLLLDASGRELYFPWLDEDDPDVAERLAGLRFPAGEGIAGAVLRSGEAQRIDDVARDDRFYAEIDRRTGLRTRSLLAAPLLGRRAPLGVMQVVNAGAGSFTDEDLDLLRALAGSVAVAIENAQLWAELRSSADRLRAEVGALRRERARREQPGGMIGTGPLMREVFRLVESAAVSPIAVLIEGETGTGKELVARAIHDMGPRASGPFVAVNCAALPETLLESELFGHRRGAFTGATQDQRGFFEVASGGTIFLDEVGEMPAAMQAKLLRVLQSGELTPIGERHPRRIDVRVVSATNRDLLAEVRERRFRDDLYYRLSVFPIHLPPLRERREDIPLLAERLLAEAAARHGGKAMAGFQPAAMEALGAFDWPGNVRELQNEVERAVALAPAGDRIGPEHLSQKVRSARGPTAAPTPTRTTSDLRAARTAFEIAFIRKVLRDHDDNVSAAARSLGISRVALQKKMKEYALR
jgi:Nif-specific regulatory protein